MCWPVGRDRPVDSVGSVSNGRGVGGASVLALILFAAAYRLRSPMTVIWLRSPMTVIAPSPK